MKHFKAMITVTLRKSILDVQGKTVEHALHSTNFTSIVDDACKSIIANPIMEDHHIELQEVSVGEAA
jgi:phosphoribosylformylglycinamidine (FGAM) synthase PurS component